MQKCPSEFPLGIKGIQSEQSAIHRHNLTGSEQYLHDQMNGSAGGILDSKFRPKTAKCEASTNGSSDQTDASLAQSDRIKILKLGGMLVLW